MRLDKFRNKKSTYLASSMTRLRASPSMTIALRVRVRVRIRVRVGFRIRVGGSKSGPEVALT